MKGLFRFGRAAVLVLLMSAAFAGCERRGEEANRAGAPPAERAAEQTPAGQTSTIVSSGEVLGIVIGMQIDDAQAKLDRLRAEGGEVDEVFEEKLQRSGGKRLQWRLAGTEFSWIVVWSDRDGRVVKISANLRPERLKPFDELGDVSKATVDQEQLAVWEVLRPGALNYRVVAKGAGRRAVNISLRAVQVEID